jgi:hypothetical protein
MDLLHLLILKDYTNNNPFSDWAFLNNNIVKNDLTLRVIINLPSCSFWKAPTFSKLLKLIGPLPPCSGANEENCGGIELSKLSNANPCRSLKPASSIDD